MSVINQVLKDLGARQGRSELRVTDMVDRQPSMSIARKRIPIATLLMVLTGVLAIGVLLWQQSQRSGLSLLESLSSRAERAAEPLKAVAVQPVVAAAIISAINIEADNESMRLVFESDKAAPGAVTQTFNADGSIDYTLAGASMQATIPALQANPFVSSYTIMQREQDVIVHLVPAADTLAFIEPGQTPGQTPSQTGHAYRTVIGARARNIPAAQIQTAATQKIAAPMPQPEAEPQAATVAPRVKPAPQVKPTAEKVVAKTPAQPADNAEKIEITRRVSQTSQAETYYRQGVEKLQADRIEPAISDLRKALGLQADMHAARELLAALLLRSGYSAEAYAELQQGMQLKPEHIAYARLYAQSLIETGHPDEALRVLTVSEPYAVQQPDYRAFMAAVAQRLTRHEEAVRHYMAALALKPARGVWWVGMAISLEALGRTSEAAQAYRTALAGAELNADLMTYAQQRVTRLVESGG